MELDMFFELQTRPKLFRRTIGIDYYKFKDLSEKAGEDFLETDYQRKMNKERKRDFGGGKSFDFTVEEMIIITLLYYRAYMTMEFIGFLIGKRKGQICKIIHRIEPSLRKVLKIEPIDRQLRKGREISSLEQLKVIIDATEQEINRPSKKQRKYYSGKKKKHTMKTQITIGLNKEILDVSKSVPGRRHDFDLFKKSNIPKVPDEIQKITDLGYIGIHAFCPNSLIPHKATKKKPLTQEQKNENRLISKVRIAVENVIGELKHFRILSHKFRNRRKYYPMAFNIIAGLVNLKKGFIKL